MKHIILFIIGFICIFFHITGCGQLQQFRDLADMDNIPPVFVSFTQTGPDKITFSFNEPVNPDNLQLAVYPEDLNYTVETNQCELDILFGSPAEPGLKYAVEATVTDLSGNSLYMLYPFYGFNPDLPDIQINEFITQGSSSHPDLVELYVLSAGNLAGMAVFEGISTLFDDYFVFPSCEVQSGDYLLVHFKPEGIPEEINELADITESGGRDASDTARDFWISGGGGLSGNNGAVCLYSNPGGVISDAVLYSNRTSSSDTKYSGFGSLKFKTQAETVFSDSAWTAGDKNIRPEDCINPDDSTSTRSICRNIAHTDTDCSSDWYIVATGEYSFGYENSTVKYGE